MDLQHTYHTLLEELFEDFARYDDGQIDYEDWRTLVDVHYRRTFGTFPTEDRHVKARLEEAAVHVGKELIDAMEDAMNAHYAQQHIEHQREDLIQHVQALLRSRRRGMQLTYPFSMRFARRDIWRLEKEVFDAQAIDADEGYGPVFDHLVEEGLFRLIERGAEVGLDVFQLVDA